MTADQLRQHYEKNGQSQVFHFWDELNETARAALLDQAAAIDLNEINQLVDSLVKGGGEAKIDFSALQPAPYETFPQHGGDPNAWAAAYNAGEQALREGRVAAFVVAGGQGTRLGYDGPKGTFPVTPLRQKSLFQVFAEKILSASREYGREIPWLIMTSIINHEATVAFFAENQNFGLKEDQVIFFSQGLMPAVDDKGKIILSDKGTIAMSPDGHGGSLRALARSGAVDQLRWRGIDTISYYQVDNPMVHIIDPAFIGWHRIKGSEMSSKMVPKAYPEEKVGHFCTLDGRTIVIEYSDLPMEMQRETLDTRHQTPDTSPQLRFLAGSIAIHMIDIDFIEKVGSGINPDFRLPFHRAHKKIQIVDDEGNTSKPDIPNGYKFEMFVFDALPFAQNPVIIECSRADEFAPVKNATGKDSPESCRAAQLAQWRSWLEAADIDLPKGEFEIEISPHFATHEQQFIEKWDALDPKPVITPGMVLE